MYILNIRKDKTSEEIKFDKLIDLYRFAKDVFLHYNSINDSKDLEVFINGKNVLYNQVTDKIEYLWG